MIRTFVIIVCDKNLQNLSSFHKRSEESLIATADDKEGVKTDADVELWTPSSVD